MVVPHGIKSFLSCSYTVKYVGIILFLHNTILEKKVTLVEPEADIFLMTRAKPTRSPKSTVVLKIS